MLAWLVAHLQDPQWHVPDGGLTEGVEPRHVPAATRHLPQRRLQLLIVVVLPFKLRIRRLLRRGHGLD